MCAPDVRRAAARRVRSAALHAILQPGYAWGPPPNYTKVRVGIGLGLALALALALTH